MMMMMTNDENRWTIMGMMNEHGEADKNHENDERYHKPLNPMKYAGKHET